MVDEKGKVKEKIQKLLAMAERGSEHEAKVAMAKAQKLLYEYKMSMEEFTGSKHTESEKVVTYRTGIYFTEYKNAYRRQLCSRLAEMYCCGFFITNVKDSQKHYLCLMGTENDVKVLESIIRFADECIMDWFRVFKRKHQDYSNKRLNAWKNKYGIGFADGIRVLLEEQRETMEQEWGIVPVVPKEAKDYISGLQKLKLNENLSWSRSAYERGYHDGRTASIHNKIIG